MEGNTTSTRLYLYGMYSVALFGESNTVFLNTGLLQFAGTVRSFPDCHSDPRGTAGLPGQLTCPTGKGDNVVWVRKHVQKHVHLIITFLMLSAPVRYSDPQLSYLE